MVGDPPAARAGLLGKGWVWLPGDGAVGYHLARGASCLADAGRGLIAPTVAGVLAPILKEMELPLTDSQTCSVLLMGMNQLPMRGSVLCTGSPDGRRDACRVTACPPWLPLGSRLVLSTHKPSPLLGRKGSSSTDSAVGTLLSKGFTRSFRIMKAGGVLCGWEYGCEQETEA